MTMTSNEHGSNFQKFRHSIETMLLEDTKSFIKALVSVELGVTNEEQLDHLYSEWMEVDSETTFLSEFFQRELLIEP